MTNEDIARMADELAVRRVLDEYCLRLEMEELAHWSELYLEDAVYEVYKLTLNGRTEIVDLIGKAPHGVHLGGAVRVVLEGDAATAIQNYGFISTSTNEWNAGWYRHSLVRTAAGWRIARTQVRFARKMPLEADERANRLAYPITFG